MSESPPRLSETGGGKGTRETGEVLLPFSHHVPQTASNCCNPLPIVFLKATEARTLFCSYVILQIQTVILQIQTVILQIRNVHQVTSNHFRVLTCLFLKGTSAQQATFCVLVMGQIQVVILRILTVILRILTVILPVSK